MAEKAIAGNLCRCTGYRPIADVCKSFAADVDMEDLGFNSFWRKGDNKDSKLSRLPQYDHNQTNSRFPLFLKEQNAKIERKQRKNMKEINDDNSESYR